MIVSLNNENIQHDCKHIQVVSLIAVLYPGHGTMTKAPKINGIRAEWLFSKWQLSCCDEGTNLMWNETKFCLNFAISKPVNQGLDIKSRAKDQGWLKNNVLQYLKICSEKIGKVLNLRHFIWFPIARVVRLFEMIITENLIIFLFSLLLLYLVFLSPTANKISKVHHDRQSITLSTAGHRSLRRRFRSLRCPIRVGCLSCEPSLTNRFQHDVFLRR